MPKLRKLVLYHPTSNMFRTTEAKVRRVVNEISETLQHLVVYGSHDSDSLFDTSLLSRLKNLRSLVYEGRLAPYDKNYIKELFPPSLRHLEIAWQGSVPFGMNLLPMLKDPTFLPKLESCPRLRYNLMWAGIGTMPTEAQLTQLIRHAVKENKLLREARPTLKVVQDLRLSADSEQDVPLCPLPVEYKTSLSQSLAAMI